MLSGTNYRRQGSLNCLSNSLYSARVSLCSFRPVQSSRLSNASSMLDVFEFATGHRPHLLPSPGPASHELPQTPVGILGNTCQLGALGPCEDPCATAVKLVRKPPIHYITLCGSGTYEIYRRGRFVHSLLRSSLHVLLQDC